MSERPPAAAPAGHYVLYGAEVSYYTAKIRAYLACKRIPFVERLATRAVFAEEILPRVGWPVIPVLVTPHGDTVQDTSDMIDLLEARYPDPAAVPPGGVGRVLSCLLELIGDEWLKLPALHYRWHYDYDFAVAEFGRNNDPDLPPDEQRRIGAKIAARFQGWREPLGINAASVPAIEAGYLAFLAALDSHFASQPWLLGAAPTLGDFAFYGPLYAHLYRDPNSGRVLRAHAPRVVDWIERLRDGPACAPLPPLEAASPSLLPVLRLLLRDYVPILVASMRATARWLATHPGAAEVPRELGRHRVTFGRDSAHAVTTERAVFSYEQWMLQRVLDAVRAAPPAEQPAVARLLAACGATPLATIDLPVRVARRQFRLVRAGAAAP